MTEAQFSTNTTIGKLMSEMAWGEMDLLGKTWNGDVTFPNISTKTSPDVQKCVAVFLELSQILVGNETKDATQYQTDPTKYLGRRQAHGSKRTGTPSPNIDPTDNIPEYQQQLIKAKLEELISIIQSTKTWLDRQEMIDLLFRFIFRERAIVSSKRSKEGKGHRSYSYFLFALVARHLPKHAAKVVDLFVHYGCWRDNHALIARFQKEPAMSPMVDALVNSYAHTLQQDAHTVYQGQGVRSENDQPIMSIPELASRVEGLYKKLETLTVQEIREQFGHYQISLAAKYMKRKDAHNSGHRDLIIAKFLGMSYEHFTNASQKSQNFWEKLFRHFITSLSKILDVVEQHMSADRWGVIDPKRVPAGAMAKYRRAFLNEPVGEAPQLGDEDGGRTKDPERIALRKLTLTAALEGALHGAGMDCCKFAQTIEHQLKTQQVIPASQRIILTAQFEHLVEDMRKIILAKHQEAIDEWEKSGKNPDQEPIHPLDVIATIDVSGSMEGANVLGPAIILGIITTILSRLGRAFITFDDNPRIIELERSGDIVSWMEQVRKAPWGGSTNIDKANDLLLEVCTKARAQDATFSGRINHVIFTDGQFNPHFCRFGNTAKYTGYDTYGYSTSQSDSMVVQSWNTFADRMKQRFMNAGFALPRTCFWNMNSQSPGFPAHGKYTGLVLAEGLNQGLFVSALCSGTSFTTDKDGATVANVDPITVLKKSLTGSDFDLVSDRLVSLH